jgi:hypothetical protein
MCKASVINGKVSLTFDGQTFHFMSRHEAQEAVDELLKAIDVIESLPQGLGINVADTVKATTHMG